MKKKSLIFLSALALSFFSACSSKEEKETGEFQDILNKPPEKVEIDKEKKKDKKSEGDKEKKKDGKSKKDKKESKNKDKKKKKRFASREPGSIWSKDSYWNKMFSVQAHRNVGDLILIRPTETLRGKISDKMAKNLDTDKQTSTLFQERTIAATLKEKLGNGVYRIYANQDIRFATQLQEVVIEGKIREKEINAKDMVLSDSIFEMKLSLPKRKKEKGKKGAGESSVDGEFDALGGGRPVGTQAVNKPKKEKKKKKRREKKKKTDKKETKDAKKEKKKKSKKT